MRSVSAAWLARRPVTAKATGSNPVRIALNPLSDLALGFSAATEEQRCWRVAGAARRKGH